MTVEHNQTFSQQRSSGRIDLLPPVSKLYLISLKDSSRLQTAAGDFGSAFCVVAKDVKMAAVVAAIVLLFSHAIEYSVQESLNEPFDLEIAILSPENALLGWNFTVPESLRIEAVVFHITYSFHGGEPRNAEHRGSYGFRFNLTGLEKKKEYSVQITATSSSYQNSKTASISFTTLEKDYPKPELVSNRLVSTRTVPKYELKWKISENQLLSGFDIEYCGQKCQTRFIGRFGAHDTIYSHEYEVDAFYAKYNFTITAVFTQPLGVHVQRSLFREGMSEVGQPSVVTNLHKVAQIGPVVHLKWDKPAKPNGPLSHYRLFIDEVIDGFIEIELKTTVNEINATLPVPASNFYRVRVTAVNLDLRAEELRSKPAVSLIAYEPPESPTKIETVSLGSDFVSFKVIPAREFPEAFYEIMIPSKGSNYTTPGTVNFTGLQPYETVYFIASTCYQEHREDRRCGRSLYASVTTNVAGPDKVEDLKIFVPEDETANVTWSEPRKLNGPLDGYIVSIVGPGSSATIIYNATLPRWKRGLPLETDECTDSCRIRVAAYNLDLRTNESVIGASVEVLYRPHTRIPSIVAGSVLTFFVVGAIVGSHVYKKKLETEASTNPSEIQSANAEETTAINDNTQ